MQIPFGLEKSLQHVLSVQSDIPQRHHHRRLLGTLLKAFHEVSLCSPIFILDNLLDDLPELYGVQDSNAQPKEIASFPVYFSEREQQLQQDVVLI